MPGSQNGICCTDNKVQFNLKRSITFIMYQYSLSKTLYSIKMLIRMFKLNLSTWKRLLKFPCFTECSIPKHTFQWFPQPLPSMHIFMTSAGPWRGLRLSSAVSSGWDFKLRYEERLSFGQVRAESLYWKDICYEKYISTCCFIYCQQKWLEFLKKGRQRLSKRSV